MSAQRTKQRWQVQYRRKIGHSPDGNAILPAFPRKRKYFLVQDDFLILRCLTQYRFGIFLSGLSGFAGTGF